jgi:hypothetical protein
MAKSCEIKSRRKLCSSSRKKSNRPAHLDPRFHMYPYPKCICHFYHPHARRPMAAEAPAEAISCLALELLVTLGKLLVPDPIGTPGPVLMRLLPVVLAKPLMFEVRRAVTGGFLIGLVPAASRVLTAVPFLKLVAGGSGRGLLLLAGVAIARCLFVGDSARG